MFGKIKDKLKKVFDSHEEIIEENPDEVVEVEERKEEIIGGEDSAKNTEEKKSTKSIEKKEDFSKKSKDSLEDNENNTNLDMSENVDESKEKKGFFSRFGKKKEDKDEEELEKLEEDMLEGVDEKEKKAILEKKEIENSEIHRRELEDKIEKEERVEKEELSVIKEDKKEISQHDEDEENVGKSGFFSKTFKKIKAKKITEDDFEKIWIELEMFLLEINIAYEIVEKIEIKLRETIIDNSYDRFKLTQTIREVLVGEVEKVLKDREGNLLEEIRKINESGEIARILVLGVNGTGKTTSIAKIVHMMKKNDLGVVVAAADTFRAAAVEQLEEHSKKVGFKLIQHKGGSDPAAVAFDSVEHAKAKNLNVALIDTAGRMPNNSNLMLELEKIKRVSKAQLCVFVGDSVSGNDLIDQINLFDKVVGIDGVILTKTDTDERPGSVVTAAYSIEKPIYYLGIGQDYDDLVKFDSKLVAQKLFEVDEEE